MSGISQNNPFNSGLLKHESSTKNALNLDKLNIFLGVSVSGDAIVDSENKFDRCCLGIFCVPLCTIPFLGREVLRKYLPNSAEGGCLLASFVMSQAAGIPKNSA